MKTESIRTQTSSQLWRSIAALAVVLALGNGNVTKAAGFASAPPQDDSTAHQTKNIHPVLDVREEGNLKDGILVAQGPAPWCYTSYGRFPMVVTLPAGAPYTVYTPYGVIAGVTGY